MISRIYLGACRDCSQSADDYMVRVDPVADPVLGSSGGAEEAGAGGGAERIVGEERSQHSQWERTALQREVGRSEEWYNHTSTTEHIECYVSTWNASIYKN